LNLQETALGLALIPLLRVVGDVAKMCGYPVGLWWRWRNRHRPEIYWRAQGAPQQDSQRKVTR
jgi:hypothetical protein